MKVSCIFHPSSRINLSHGGHVQLWLLGGDDTSKEIVSAWIVMAGDHMIRVLEHFIYPLCLIKMRDHGTPTWYDVLSDCGRDIPYVCVAENSEFSIVSIGVGRRAISYDTGSPRIRWELRTEYPISNILVVPSLPDLCLVTEVTVSMVGDAGTEKWEYWSPEPIEDAWIDGATVFCLDIEGTVTKLNIETGLLIGGRA